MEIVRNIDQYNIDGDSAIALGKFDGIHLGHEIILKEVLSKRAQGLKAVVFTFDIPVTGFLKGTSLKEVTTLDEKELIFEEMGIDVLVEYQLNAASASISPEEFIKKILCEHLHMKYICAGADISYGNKGLGDEALLRKLSSAYDYEVNIIDKRIYEGREISSTFVREEIEKGHMDVVTNLLGHPYSFTGRVESGFKLGHKLGMPTLNQYPDERKMLPPLGVYYSDVMHRNTLYHGITNIGKRPTVSDSERVSVETYLYDFDYDIYGEDIVTFLLDFKRPEMKFGGVEELKKQMEKDIAEGASFHGLNMSK